MTTLDYVALSLLPSARRRAASALAVLPPALLDACDALELLIGYCSRAEPDPAARARHLRAEAATALARAAATASVPIPWPDPAYPASLRQIVDAPAVLWVSGDPAALGTTAVAVVGSRAASPYGIEVAERLGDELARAGITVLSGLARGCDAAAHRGALAGGGVTVAVLGCGPDVVYPAEHRDLADRVRAAGALVSELPPGTAPLAAHFPQRNRIISGLARVTVVVEAGEGSGALITAGTALDQGREVMAVPGPITSPQSVGANRLIRDGAAPLLEARDLLDHYPDAAPPRGARPYGACRALPDSLAPADRAVAELLGAEPVGLDDLIARSGQSPGALLAALCGLEIAGVVEQRPGRRFLRT